MASQKELDLVYLNHATTISQLSKANRLKVGATMVTPSGIMLSGYNGTAKGQDNTCETVDNVTKINVIHAEENCIIKAAREGVSLYNATAYMTHAPCEHCAAMMINTGISRVVFNLYYRSDAGLKSLEKAGIIVQPVWELK